MYPKIITLATRNAEPATVIKDIDELVRDNPNASADIQTLIAQANDGFVWAINHFSGQYQ
jgi:hypothetical protein